MNAHYLVGVDASPLEVVLDGLALPLTGVGVEVLAEGVIAVPEPNFPFVCMGADVGICVGVALYVRLEVPEDLQKARHDGSFFVKIALSLREPPCTLLEGDLRHLLLAPQRVRAHVPVTVC